MKISIQIVLAVFIIFLTTIGQCQVDVDNAAANRWDSYFKRKLFDPPVGFVLEALKFIPNKTTDKIAIDFGSGVGHESMLLLKSGFNVIAVDNQEAAFKYMRTLPDFEKYQEKFKPIVSSFEKLNYENLPAADMIIASFSLPFVSENDFNQVWINVTSKLKVGGYFIGNLFDPKFTFFDKKFRPYMTFHTREQALSLLNNFKIIYFEEVNVPSLKEGTNNYYYYFIAKKEADITPHLKPAEEELIE